jgi:hypothetical protein
VGGLLLGAALAVGVTVGWYPLRHGQSNVEVALALMVVTLVAGASRIREAIIGAVLGGVVGFTYFDTEPYEHFAISRGADIATAVCLALVGAVVGELALRLAGNRHQEGTAAEHLSRVRDAAALLADGEELIVLIGAVAEELVRVVGVPEANFSTERLPSGTPLVARDGTVEGHARAGFEQVAVPVWALGRIVGHFLLGPVPAGGLRYDRLQVAFTLADQVGAALAAQAALTTSPDDVPPDPTPFTPRLRLLRRP